LIHWSGPSSWANPFPKPLWLNIALETKPLTHEFQGDSSFLNHNIWFV
jgi:hypothetical protein